MSESKNKNWFHSWGIWILVTILGLVLVTLIVHWIYPVEPQNIKRITKTNISAGELLGFMGGYLAFVGTLFLGFTSLKHNRKLHDEIIHKEERAEKRKENIWTRNAITELKKMLLCKENVQKDIDEKRFPFEINILKNKYIAEEYYALKVLGDDSDKFFDLMYGLRNLEIDIKNYAMLSKKKEANELSQVIMIQRLGGTIDTNNSDDSEVIASTYENINTGFNVYYNIELIEEIINLLDRKLQEDNHE